MPSKKDQPDTVKVGDGEITVPADAPYRTGPNVDNGLVEGAVTLDPHTAAGQAAAAAREVNGAKTKHEDGTTVVTQKGEPEGQGLISVEPVGGKAVTGAEVVEVK